MYLLFRGERVDRPKNAKALSVAMDTYPDGVGVSITQDTQRMPVPPFTSMHHEAQVTATSAEGAAVITDDTAAERRRTIAVPLMHSESPGHELVLECRATETLLSIEIVSHVTENGAKIFDDGFSPSSLRSILISLGRSPNRISPFELLGFLEADLAGRLIASLLTASGRIVAEVRRAITSDGTSEAALDASIRTFDLQMAASAVLASFSRFDNDSRGLAATASACLATATSLRQLLESNNVLRHHQAVADLAAREAVADSVIARRTDRLSRIGASFLLPTLWYGLLGANVFPNKSVPFAFDGAIGFWFSLCGGAVAAAVGYFWVGKVGDSNDA